MRRTSGKPVRWAAGGGAPALLGMMLSLAAAATVVPARPAWAQQRPVEGPGVMDEPIVRHRLAELGYTDISGLKRDGDVWKATARKDGVDRTVEVHALSGVVSGGSPAK